MKPVALLTPIGQIFGRLRLIGIVIPITSEDVAGVMVGKRTQPSSPFAHQTAIMYAGVREISGSTLLLVVTKADAMC